MEGKMLEMLRTKLSATDSEVKFVKEMMDVFSFYDITIASKPFRGSIVPVIAQFQIDDEKYMIVTKSSSRRCHAFVIAPYLQYFAKDITCSIIDNNTGCGDVFVDDTTGTGDEMFFSYVAPNDNKHVACFERLQPMFFNKNDEKYYKKQRYYQLVRNAIIQGSVGVGKSTFAKDLVASELFDTYIPESIDENALADIAEGKSLKGETRFYQTHFSNNVRPLQVCSSSIIERSNRCVANFVKAHMSSHIGYSGKQFTNQFAKMLSSESRNPVPLCIFISCPPQLAEKHISEREDKHDGNDHWPLSVLGRIEEEHRKSFSNDNNNMADYAGGLRFHYNQSSLEKCCFVLARAVNAANVMLNHDLLNYRNTHLPAKSLFEAKPVWLSNMPRYGTNNKTTIIMYTDGDICVQWRGHQAKNVGMSLFLWPSEPLKGYRQESIVMLTELSKCISAADVESRIFSFVPRESDIDRESSSEESDEEDEEDEEGSKDGHDSDHDSDDEHDEEEEPEQEEPEQEERSSTPPPPPYESLEHETEQSKEPENKDKAPKQKKGRKKKEVGFSGHELSRVIC